MKTGFLVTSKGLWYVNNYEIYYKCILWPELFPDFKNFP